MNNYSIFLGTRQVSDKSLVDSLEDTVVWEYDHGLPADDCTPLQMAHEGLHKLMNVLEGGTAVVEHKDKDQAAGLEIAESFMLYRHQTYKTHIKSISCLRPQ